MEKKGNACLLIVFISTLLFTFLFTTQSIQAGGDKNYDNNCPIWKIFKNGTNQSVYWKKHKPNPRFMIHNSGTPDDPYDDLVLDLETCLIWERSPNNSGMRFDNARQYCWGKTFANRRGSRLPTIEELSTLVDTSNDNPALPTGHRRWSQKTGQYDKL